MRSLMVIAAVLVLSACHRQSDFDEAYKSQSDQAVQAASSMEAEMQQRLNASSAAGHGVSAQ
jgi:outer membrane lipoprotein-sorting protein